MMWSLERLPEWLYWSIVRLRLDLACKVGCINVLCYQAQLESSGDDISRLILAVLVCNLLPYGSLWMEWLLPLCG